MDNQAYLNQISASNRSTKKSNPFLSSAIFKVLVGGIIALVLVIILGAIINSNKTDTKSKCISLHFHFNNLTSVIEKYQPSVKSSALRGSSASLKSLVSNINSDLNNYLIDKYEFKEKDVDEKLVADETALYEALDVELFEAKINGFLDRTYARKMAYEISIIQTRESEISKSIKEESLKQALTNSYNSLENLYESFDSFSETK